MKGLSQRTTKLGFNVLRLHYSADPDKDPATPQGAAWYEEARKGMSDARWRQEYELDYGALGGQLVFPDFEETIHCVDGTGFPTRDTAMIYLGCDPHPRTPHAFLWLAVDALGDLTVLWSRWDGDGGKLRTINEYAEYLKEVHKGPLNPRYRVMDQAGKSFNAEENVNYFEKYRRAVDERGMSCSIVFNPAKRNIGYVGYNEINQALRPRIVVVDGVEVRRPRLTIRRTMLGTPCGHNSELVRQLKTLRYREWTGNVVGKDAPEEPQQGDRHLIDCLSYIMLDGPRFVAPRYEPVDEEDDPNVVIATGGSRN